MKIIGSIVLPLVITASVVAQHPDEPFVTEHYYKAKWGYAEEFINLYKKNHYPLMKKLQEKGDILRIVVEKPRLHSSEDSRWDYRVILVWKNARVSYDSQSSEPYKRELYPDQVTFVKEEKRRFEILEAHWDIPTEVVNLDE